MRNRFDQRLRRPNAQFIAAVIAPVILLAIGLTIFAFSALRSAAQQADQVSAHRQAQEVSLAVNDALDELPQSQAGVAIWSPLVLQLRKAKPDWIWVDNNVGIWLNSVFAHDADFVLDADDKPSYAMRDGVHASPDGFAAIARTASPLIEAVRGRALIAPNAHERLPGQATLATSTVRTSPRAIHATDLVVVSGRPAIMSVMRIIPDTKEIRQTPGREPLLVSLRYLDTAFARQLDKIQLLTGAHIQRGADIKRGEYAFALVSSRLGQVGYVVWRPDKPGKAVWSAMAPSAGFALLGLLAMLAALIFSIAKLMRRNALSFEQLRATHVELKAKEAQAYHLAYHDALTGLPNRAFFNSAADQMVASARDESPFAILLIDLDRFKQVNDSLGHQGGDELLRGVADRMRETVGGEDVIARLGGDEFAMIFRERGSGDDVSGIARAMVASLRKPFDIFGTKVFIGASIGIARYPCSSRDRSELMRMADIAMYRAKFDGRDGFRFFTEDIDSSVRLRQEIERDLRDALAHKRGLYVQYQPQMDASGLRVIGLEALLRWQHPVRGLLTPQTFIPVAEETGLIRALGRWVLSEACNVARSWPDLSIAVNLSPVQFRSHGFADEVAAIVAGAGVSPHQIELEVTESILLDNDVLVSKALSTLREAGFRIALDDFGTGYSSLSYLNKFKVDKIKIDRSFTSRLGVAKDASAIVQAVIRLGHAMGLTVCAEGVETLEQRALLEVAGCNELQGFLFSAAISKDDLVATIGRKSRIEAA